MSGPSPTERFGAVVLPHLGDALALARWLTGNSHDAEDVVQEACIKALRGIDTFAGGSARAWFLTVVRNACFTWLARNRPRDLVLVGGLNELDEEAGASEGMESPEAAVIAKADAAALERAIAALPTHLREIVVLRDINGLGYRDIAAILSVPIGTVMSRLSRARGQLMRDLGGPR
ncbi:sigma-70 family RNA polymerase sigma factor [Lichenifustis flavocetrariae]|uniref:RNA polymerase sigma factor n=1 Tax=Lichenifustis flavocetrariae TaxID=2949735 RepID=A0AA42CMA0_9HYPH|nr:sigma-70 family RNA polymerase sigma factor [Lichenifustis flavocetrariae]MCW6508177.1 sigma-70 family RNA polymerase sigma factor [Lichenifustis flavocetrariae]